MQPVNPWLIAVAVALFAFIVVAIRYRDEPAAEEDDDEIAECAGPGDATASNVRAARQAAEKARRSINGKPF
jgi:hypothetical protein